MINLEGTGDLFDEAKPGDRGAMGLDNTFTLMMKGKKIALQSKDEVWNESLRKIINQSYWRTFDGFTNKAMIIGEVLSYPTAQANNEAKPDETLTKNTHYVPLWLSFVPDEMLTRLGFDVSRMSLINDRALYQGIECIEVTVPRGPDICHLYIDPALRHLPIGFVEWRRDGSLRADIYLEYETNEELGWVISGWMSRLYGIDNQVDTTLSGSVKSVAVNEAISDNEFDIEFPVATRIRETLDGKTKYFILEENGVRRQIGN
jgi:hypothetical protein